MNRDGIVLVDKPASWTSFDVVAKIRGAIRDSYASKGLKPTKRQLKVGHTGTLDPFATGLLIILLGDACSRSDEFLKLDKVYEATIELGKTSSTGDPEGEIIEHKDIPSLTREDIEGALEKFIGRIEQTPPVYSAIKIDGQRAYKLARKGQKVEMPKRSVEIYSLECVSYSYPELRIRAHVSSGTYIRTLAEDIGKELGAGGYCKGLRRTRVGSYDIRDAQSIEHILQDVQDKGDSKQNYN